MKIITALAEAVVAVLALSATASVAASAAPEHRHGHVLCDRSGRGRCLTVRYWHRGSALRAGHGTPVRVVPAGYVTRSWPFMRSPWLNRQLRGMRLVQVHEGRSCVGSSALGAVRLTHCSRASLWVPGLGGAHSLASVRASDASGVPCLLSAVRQPWHLWAVVMNGHAIGLQQWARRSGSAHRS